MAGKDKVRQVWPEVGPWGIWPREGAEIVFGRRGHRGLGWGVASHGEIKGRGENKNPARTEGYPFRSGRIDSFAYICGCCCALPVLSVGVKGSWHSRRPETAEMLPAVAVTEFFRCILRLRCRRCKRLSAIPLHSSARRFC